MERGLEGVKRLPYEKALRAGTTHRHDYLNTYVADLGTSWTWRRSAARASAWVWIPSAGPGVHYWAPIAERYHLDLTVVSDVVDQTFRFMTVDWDGPYPDGPPRRPTRCSG